MDWNFKSQRRDTIHSILARSVIDELVMKLDFLTKFTCPECYEEMFSTHKFGVKSNGHTFCLNNDLYKMQYVLGLHPEIIMFFIDRESVEQNFFKALSALEIESVPFYICSSKHLRDCVRNVNFLEEIEAHYKHDLFSLNEPKRKPDIHYGDGSLNYDFDLSTPQMDSPPLLLSQRDAFNNYFD